MDVDNNFERELIKEIRIKDEQIMQLVEKIKEMDKRIALLEAYNYERYTNYYY